MKRINNYHDLVVEKQRLQQQLELLKRDVDSEIYEIKQNFKPLTNMVGLFTGNRNDDDGDKKESLLKTGLKAGANFGMEMLVGSKLRKAGLVTRLLVPPLLRGISSGILSRFKKKKK